MVKPCGAACPAGGRDRHRARTNGGDRIEHEVRRQRRTAAHDDVVDRHAATADGHRRGADDEIGARQRDRHRGAPDALIRRDARQRRSARSRRQIDREGLRAAGPGGRRDRHRAGTLSRGRIEHEVGGQRRPAAHDDGVDRHAATADGHRRGTDDEIGARQRDRDRGAPDALIWRDAGQRRRAGAGRLIVKICAAAGPGGRRDRHRAGTVAAVGSITKLAVSDVAAAHDDVGDRHAATADRHRRGADDEIGARQRDRHRGARSALIRRDAGQRRSAGRRQH